MYVMVRLDKGTELIFDCTGAHDDIDIQGCTMLSDTFEYPHTGIEMPDDVAIMLAENYFDIISEKYAMALRDADEAAAEARREP